MKRAEINNQQSTISNRQSMQSVRRRPWPRTRSSARGWATASQNPPNLEATLSANCKVVAHIDPGNGRSIVQAFEAGPLSSGARSPPERSRLGLAIAVSGGGDACSGLTMPFSFFRIMT